MDIGLIDADLLDNGTRFPNLALMKISGYYKSKGYNTKLISYDEILNYDKVYLAKVFDYTNIPINLYFYPNLEWGGTGFNFDKQDFLPDEIEHHYPDYGLYDEYVNKKIKESIPRKKLKYYLDFSIGFTTRFCFRQCDFCVNRNRKKVELWSSIDEFYNSNKKYLTMLDDNFLGFSDCEDILKELIKLNKPFEFKQGLDIRLLTANKAKLLTNSKYHGDYIFAFDNYEEKNLIISKLKLWRSYCNKSTKLYVLVAYEGLGKNDIKKMFERIKILMEYNCLPYIMRYKNYKQSKWKGLYTTVARWCNQPNFYKKMSFGEFCYANGKKSASVRYMKQFEEEYPQIAKEYFNMKYEDF